MKFWCQLFKKNDNMIINNWLESGKKNQQENWLYFFFVCLEGTNCSLNCMEVQLSLMGTLFLHLGASMELKSTAQEDNLRPRLESSAEADLFLRPIFFYRTWISWFHTNLMSISRDDSFLIQSKKQFTAPSVHTTSTFGERKGNPLQESWLLASSQETALLLLSAQPTAGEGH